MHAVVRESLLFCGIDPPWDLSFGWSQIEAVIELLFLFSGGPTSNYTHIQMQGDQVCDAQYLYPHQRRHHLEGEVIFVIRSSHKNPNMDLGSY